MSRDSTLAIVLVYPHLLGTYGDAGNATVLHRRARDRDIDAQVITIQPGQALPRSGDVYLLGGGEDAKQTAAAQQLILDGGLTAAVAAGAAVLGVCAGYQLLGQSFLGVGAVVSPGLGLLDVRTDRMGRRAVGNLLARPAVAGLPSLIGFENHGGATVLGPAAVPLGSVEVGVGNGDGSHTEGAVQGRVFGTYLHGPALALNPALADLLLTAETGALAPLDDELTERLRRHRRNEVLPAAARAHRRRRLMAVLRRRDEGAGGAAASLSSTVS